MDDLERDRRHERLRVDLGQLGHDLDVRLGDRDLSAAVEHALRGAPAPTATPFFASRRRQLAAAVAAVLVTVLAVPPARAAVAGFLRIGAAEVAPPEAAPPPTTAAPATPIPTSTFARFSMLGPVVSLDAARTTLPLVVPADATLGAPDEVRAEQANGPHASLLYRARAGLPALADGDGAGLIVEEFVGNGRTMVRKYRASGTGAEPVEVAGEPGVYLDGLHTVFYEDALGNDVTATARTAGRALIFQRGELTIRLEADLPRDELVRIAGSLR